MSFTGIYQFGSLTTRNGQVYTFEDIDKDGDGKISQQEYMFIQKELGMDTLEISNSEEKSEKNVTDSEYVLWAIEMQMDSALDAIITQISTEFIGANAQYAQPIISELRAFLKEFKENYLNSGEKLSEMYNKFAEELPKKYNSLKEYYLGNK